MHSAKQEAGVVHLGAIYRPPTRTNTMYSLTEAWPTNRMYTLICCSIGLTCMGSVEPFWKQMNVLRNTAKQRNICQSVGALQYCPHRNDYNFNSWQIENVIVSVIDVKVILLGIPRCNCNQRIFPRNYYISRESIRPGIKRWNCNCNFQEINSPKQKKLHVIILMTRVFRKLGCRICNRASRFNTRP